jgi:ABC-type methionine transport system ATPase subunit
MLPKLALEQITIERSVRVDGQVRPLRVVAGVNLAVPAGGRLALAGPSGAGKTSLLRLMNRLDEPAGGRVLLDGIDIRELDPQALRRRVGVLFQQPALFDDTVIGNLAYPGRLLGQSLAEARAEALLIECGLPCDLSSRQARELSGGQQQRVALARALTLDPEVLLLDEPTSALDEESAEALVTALLRRNTEHGLTLVVVAHSRQVLQRLACPTALVAGGTVRMFPDAEAALAEAARAHLEVS